VSPDADEASYERLGYSQVDTTDPRRLISQLQEENQWLIQQLDEAVTAKAKLEAENEGWAKKPKELRHSSRSERGREKNGSSTQARLGKEREKEKDTITADVLKEENDKLKTMLRRQAQQLEHASNESKRIRKEKDALIEAWKTSSQQQAQHIEHLSAEREKLRKEWETKAANLTAEIEKLKLTQSKQSEDTKAALAEVNRDRRLTHSELHKARQTLYMYTFELKGSACRTITRKPQNFLHRTARHLLKLGAQRRPELPHDCRRLLRLRGHQYPPEAQRRSATKHRVYGRVHGGAVRAFDDEARFQDGRSGSGG
jgi:chromosome segregation ATPase